MTYFRAGSGGTVSTSCRHTILSSNHCFVALVHRRTVSVLHKRYINLSLHLGTFPPFYHSLKYFSVSTLLRCSIAHFLLCSIVSTLSCSLSTFFMSPCRFVRLSLRVFQLFFLSPLRSSISPSLYFCISPSGFSLKLQIYHLFVSPTLHNSVSPCF